MSELRKEFEQWFEADSMPAESDWFRLDEEGDYALDFVYWSWKGWQGARSRAPVQASEARGDVVADTLSNLARMAKWCRSGEDESGVGTFIPAYCSGDVYDILGNAADLIRRLSAHTQAGPVDGLERDYHELRVAYDKLFDEATRLKAKIPPDDSPAVHGYITGQDSPRSMG